jgi:hypothetical protein
MEPSTPLRRDDQGLLSRRKDEPRIAPCPVNSIAPLSEVSSEAPSIMLYSKRFDTAIMCGQTVSASIAYRGMSRIRLCRAMPCDAALKVDDGGFVNLSLLNAIVAFVVVHTKFSRGYLYKSARKEA